MKKVFLYLYPIEEYTRMFMFYNESFYEIEGIKRPLPILNEAIDKRYRENGYEIVYALYPDKKLFGLEKQNGDRIIYTDIKFDESSAIDSNGNKKENFVPKYPSEKYLIDQLGNVDYLVVGGYHFSDCVKKVAVYALENGIDTLIDIDLTDLFFSLYKHEEYFKVDNYSPERYREFMINKLRPSNNGFREHLFDKNYASPVYGFNTNNEHNKKH